MALQRFAFSLILRGTAALAQQCYYPNGQPTGSEGEYVPCNKTTSSGYSNCCNIEDACTTTNLCTGHGGVYYVGGCTDRTWQAPECSSHCDNAENNGWTELLQCEPEGTSPLYTWCCWNPGVQGSNSCCDNTFTMNTAAWGQVYLHASNGTTSSALSASSTSPPTSSATKSASSASASASPSSKSGLDLASTIGLAVGIPLGILVIAVMGILFWWMRRKANKRDTPPGPHGYSDPSMRQDTGYGSTMSPMYSQGGVSPATMKHQQHPQPTYRPELGDTSQQEPRELAARSPVLK